MLFPLMVYAENKIEIKSINFLDKSENTKIIEEASTDGDKISLNIEFFDVDDYASYEVVLYNPNDVRLYINDDLLELNDEHISYIFNYDDNNYIEPKIKKTITFKVFYKTEIDKSLFRSAKYNASGISFLPLSDNINIPDTLKNLGLPTIILMIIVVFNLIIGLILLIINNKKTPISILIICILLLPLIANAKEFIKIPIDNKIVVKLIKENPCAYDGELVQGAELVVGQYTYRYKQRNEGGRSTFDSDAYHNWTNSSTDGWGVRVTDPNSTDPITTKMCTSINDIPITDFSYTYVGSKAEYVDLSSVDTSHADSLTMTFSYSNFKSLDLYYFDTSNFKILTNTFYKMYLLEKVDLSSWDTSNVTYFSGLFYVSKELKEAIIDNLDFSKNTNYSADYFASCTSLKKISAKNVKLAKVPNSMFKISSNDNVLEEIDVTGMDLSESESLYAFFEYLPKLKKIVGLNTWDTSNIKQIDYMFKGDTILGSLDMSSWDLSNVTIYDDFLVGCEGLREIILPKVLPPNDIPLPSLYRDSDGLYYVNILDNNKPGTRIFIDGAMLISGRDINIGMKKLAGISSPSAYTVDSTITGFKRANSLPDDSVHKEKISRSNTLYDAYMWIDGTVIYYYTEADVLYLNYDSTTMFNYLYMLHDIELDDFNAYGVNSTESMFYNVGHDYTGDINLDLTNLEFINATYSASMFNGLGYNSNSVTLTLNNWKMPKVYYIKHMFSKIGYNAKNVVLNLNNIELSSVTSIQYAFDSTGRYADNITINAKNWQLDILEQCDQLFYSTASDAKKINIDLSGWNVSSVKNMNNLFRSVNGNGDDITINLTGWDTSNVENMSYLFYYLGAGAKDIKIIGIENWNVSNVSDFSYAFYNVARDANKFEVDLSGWNVESAINMFGMFAYSGTHANKWSIGKLDNWDTRNVTNMRMMFRDVGYDLSAAVDIGTFNVYCTDIYMTFNNFKNVKITLNLYNNPDSYGGVLTNTAINNGNVVVNYTSDVTSIDDIIATNTDSTNVHKGELIT
jgi:surface protein